MAFACDYLVLKLLADADEVGVVARYSHQQVAVILRMGLRILEHLGVEYVYLQRGAAVSYIALDEGLELILVGRVGNEGGVEGDGVACAVGQAVEVILKVAVFTVAAEGKDLSYQWYYKNATGKKFAAITDATTL